jgi:hypothetical protein
MKNRLLPFLLVFFCSLCFGLLFIALFMNARDINCTRQANQTYTCQFKTLFFGRYLIRERRVENITDIVMQRDSCDDGCSYRAEFISSDGKREPLSSIFTDQNTVTQQVNTIGSQMDAGLEQITYRSDPPWWVLYLVGGLTLMAMLLPPLMFLKGKKSMIRQS